MGAGRGWEADTSSAVKHAGRTMEKEEVEEEGLSGGNCGGKEGTGGAVVQTPMQEESSGVEEGEHR